MQTGLEVVFHSKHDGTAQEMLDSMYLGHFPFAVLADGSIKCPLKPPYSGEEDPNSVLTILGESYALEAGPPALPDGTVYKGSYGFGLESPFDFYTTPWDDYGRIIHLNSGTSQMAVYAPLGLTHLLSSHAIVVDDQDYSFLRYYYWSLDGEITLETPIFPVCHINHGNEALNILPWGLQSKGNFDGTGYLNERRIVVEDVGDGANGLAGYQIVEIL
jgi:hypothetical protein